MKTTQLRVHFAFFLLWPALLVPPPAHAADPVLIGPWPGHPRGPVTSLLVTNNLAYVLMNHEAGGLLLLDVSNPAKPTPVSSYSYLDNPWWASGVHVVGNLAYVANGGLEIFDVSDPAKLLRYGEASIAAFDVQVVGDLAYVAAGTAGLEIVDVRNPAKPVRVGGYEGPPSEDIWNTTSVQVAGSLAYVTSSHFTGAGFLGLRILDVSNPTSPSLVGSFDLGSSANRVQIVGKLAYVATGAVLEDPPGAIRGLRILDVSNPAAPILLSSYRSTYVASDVHVVGNLACVADYSDGLHIVNVSDPSNPVRVGGFKRGGDESFGSSAVHVVGNLAYLADQAGLQILDLRKIVQPVLRISQSGGLPALQLNGVVGANYVLESVPSLPADGNWTTLSTVTLTNNPQTVVDPAFTSGSQRFYRARVMP